MLNRVISVGIDAFDKTHADRLVNCQPNEREKKSQKLLDYLCKRFKIANVKIILNNETNGYSYYSNNEIIICNSLSLDAKSYFDTLLLLFMQHYDKQYLKLERIIKDECFYKRLNNLKNKLTDTLL